MASEEKLNNREDRWRQKDYAHENEGQYDLASTTAYSP